MGDALDKLLALDIPEGCTYSQMIQNAARHHDDVPQDLYKDALLAIACEAIMVLEARVQVLELRLGT